MAGTRESQSTDESSRTIAWIQLGIGRPKAGFLKREAGRAQHFNPTTRHLANICIIAPSTVFRSGSHSDRDRNLLRGGWNPLHVYIPMTNLISMCSWDVMSSIQVLQSTISREITINIMMRSIHNIASDQHCRLISLHRIYSLLESLHSPPFSATLPIPNNP